VLTLNGKEHEVKQIWPVEIMSAIIRCRIFCLPFCYQKV